MEIYWKSDKLRKQLEDLSYLRSKYDQRIAKNVVKRLKEIYSFPSYEDLPISTRKHVIRDGKRFKYFTVDLPGKGGGRGRWRLAFIPYGACDLLDYRSITEVQIIGIVDYH